MKRRTPMSATTRHAKAVAADIACRQHLAAATDAREAGSNAKADNHERKAQWWLDRLNRLEGNS